jgi:hypothetical protein
MFSALVHWNGSPDADSFIVLPRHVTSDNRPPQSMAGSNARAGAGVGVGEGGTGVRGTGVGVTGAYGM